MCHDVAVSAASPVEIDTTHMGFAVSRAALAQINREIVKFLEEFPG